MAFTESAYSDLTYEEALAVLEGEIHIIDPALIFAAREKAKEALKIMTNKEEKDMKQTEGRYPLIDTKHAAGTVLGIWEMRDHIDFLKDFDPKKEAEAMPPYDRLSHNQHRLILGRAARTVEAVLRMGATQEEIERAVKFAFIAIDAEKHQLDIRKAMVKYGFRELEDKYAKGIQE